MSIVAIENCLSTEEKETLLCLKTPCVYTFSERGYRMTLGERILILRRRLKMSQATLARASGLDKNTIARLEQGRVKDLSGETVVRVARALQVSTDALLGVAPLDGASELVPATVA